MSAIPTPAAATESPIPHSLRIRLPIFPELKKTPTHVPIQTRIARILLRVGIFLRPGVVDLAAV